jgi:hypothetical protein
MRAFKNKYLGTGSVVHSRPSTISILGRRYVNRNHNQSTSYPQYLVDSTPNNHRWIHQQIQHNRYTPRNDQL